MVTQETTFTCWLICTPWIQLKHSTTHTSYIEAIGPSTQRIQQEHCCYLRPISRWLTGLTERSRFLSHVSFRKRSMVGAWPGVLPCGKYTSSASCCFLQQDTWGHTYPDQWELWQIQRYRSCDQTLDTLKFFDECQKSGPKCSWKLCRQWEAASLVFISI